MYCRMWRGNTLNLGCDQKKCTFRVMSIDMSNILQDMLELLGSWTLSDVRFSKKLENLVFRKLDLFPSSDEWETPILSSVP